MSYGAGNISFKNNSAGGGMPGPPFDPDSADNGLSVDPISGRIVFGNDIGLTTAELLSDRYVPLNGHDIYFTPSNDPTEFIQIREGTGVVPGIAVIYNRDNDIGSWNAKNNSAGTAAATLYSLFNDTGNHMRVGVTGSGFVTGTAIANFPANACFIDAGDFAGLSPMYIRAQNGIFWEGDAAGAVVSPEVQLLNKQFEILSSLGLKLNNGSTLQDIGGVFLSVTPVGGTVRFTGAPASLQVFNSAGSDGILIDSLLSKLQRISGAGPITLQYGLNILGDTTLLHTGTRLANGAGVALGTLANAPTAGNPTKWISIDDNGTTRFIPTWQ